ncbi:HAD-IA family hydrolase [Floccifex sp.]|uniref:HAD-IA family hydrolase n=1 Tax=Floccifex sp. TaxID=2815810 RepID=UPI003F129D27
MKYKAILYDLDQTLINTLDMNMYPLIKIIKEEKGIELSFEQACQYASYPGMKVMELLDIKNPEQTYKRWVQYVNEYENGALVYPNIKNVLKTFQRNQIKQGIVTSKLSKQYKIDAIDNGLDAIMDVVVLFEDTKKHKPDPAPLLKCMELLNLDKDEVIYIGDAASDFEASKNAGIDFGFAKWGSVLNHISESNYIFTKPEDLLILLDQ